MQTVSPNMIRPTCIQPVGIVRSCLNDTSDALPFQSSSDQVLDSTHRNDATCRISHRSARRLRDVTAISTHQRSLFTLVDDPVAVRGSDRIRSSGTSNMVYKPGILGRRSQPLMKARK